jgi:hypothetical protein
LITGFLTSGSGLAVIAVIVAWVGAVNLSSSTENLTVRLTNFVSSNTSPVVYLAGIIIAVGLSYRFPKTIMFLSSLILATFYLTPVTATSAMVESYKLILTLSSIGFFTLAIVFYGLKRRHRRGLLYRA